MHIFSNIYFYCKNFERNLNNLRICINYLLTVCLPVNLNYPQRVGYAVRGQRGAEADEGTPEKVIDCGICLG